jgi:UDP-N-acetylglucosamine transferase subunit ALG13
VGKEFFEESDRKKLIAAADIIITHAGAGCIIDSLVAGKPTIVFPRLKKFGEHTDDHQLEIAKAFGAEGKVIPVYDISGITKAIKDIKELKLGISKCSLTERLSEYLKDIDSMH